jgi:hypothetical protein
MNTLRLSLLSITMVLVASTVYANPCETLLCMAGKLQGQSSGSDCSTPISDYFGIVRFGKHGRFSPSKTAAARLSFLNSCAAPGIGDWPDRINAVYGTVLF